MNFYLVCFHENSLPKCFPIWWNLELTMFPRRRIPRFLWTKPKLDLCHKILCITHWAHLQTSSLLYSTALRKIECRKNGAVSHRSAGPRLGSGLN